MKKFSMFVVAALVAAIFICGCAPVEEQYESDIDELRARISYLKSEISSLEAERSELLDEISDIKIENGTAKYVVTFNIRQSHFTLDLGQHLKDAMNDISIQIPVDKEYYDSVRVGDVIDDSFRMGSFLFKGSFGNWNVSVEDKCIQ